LQHDNIVLVNSMRVFCLEVDDLLGIVEPMQGNNYKQSRVVYNCVVSSYSRGI